MNSAERKGPGTSELYLIHDDGMDPERLARSAPARRILSVPWKERDTPPAGSRVLLCLGDEQLRELAPHAVEQGWEVGLLPHPAADQATRALGVKGSLEQVFDHYAQTEAIEADILVCNDLVVFSSVAIGEVLNLRPYRADRPPERSSILSSVRSIRSLRLRDFRLSTGKGQRTQLAALGLVVMEHTQSTLMGRAFAEVLSISDGRMALLALAPRSILSHLWFLIRILIPGKIRLSTLPEAVGLIRSDQILIEAPGGVEYSLDGTLASSKSIELRVLDRRLRLLPGPALLPREVQRQAKDSVRLGHLPVGEAARELIDAPLPLFSHASEEEYRELFVSLRENAALSPPFLVLMVLSVMLALSGLYANSAPVIIGAMILAPLMAPIISLAMGLARTESSLIRNALRTLMIGVGSSLACAVSVAWLMPLEHLTAEMQARLSPTLLDLSVAVIAGIAGAYAHAKEEVAKSLAGVAIAVALVPPLSVAGIALGWADWGMAKGALLLFFTNLVGISLAASTTFLVLGFAPFRLARKGLGVTLILAALVVGPLYVAFANLVVQGSIAEQIPTGRLEIAGEPVEVRLLDVKAGEPPRVRVVMSSPHALGEDHVDALKEMINEKTGQTVSLEAQLNLTR